MKQSTGLVQICAKRWLTSSRRESGTGVGLRWKAVDAIESCAVEDLRVRTSVFNINSSSLMSAGNLETPQVPSHITYTSSHSSPSSVSSVSDIANSHSSWDMDGVPTITFGGNAVSATSHEAQEHPLTPHTKHFYTNGMIDIRVRRDLTTSSSVTHINPRSGRKRAIPHPSTGTSQLLQVICCAYESSR